MRDTTKPVITLLGSTIVNIVRGGTYTEAGVTISDNYYKGLFPVITGTVLTNVLGQYTLLYDVTDGSNNKAVTVQRIVNVNPPAGITTNLGLNSFSLTPNPTHDLVNLKLQFNEPSKVKITLTDIQGKILVSFDEQILTKEFQIHLNDYASGIYLLNISNSQGTITQKIIKD